MATYVKDRPNVYPSYGDLWESPIDGQFFYLRERQFPRFDRMICLMENLDGYHEWFVFPV